VVLVNKQWCVRVNLMIQLFEDDFL
jgi:hypothetical protein